MNTPTTVPLVAITPAAGDLPVLRLIAPDGSRAEVYLYGAHVVSWVPPAARSVCS